MCGRYVTPADAMSFENLMVLLDGPSAALVEPREVSVGATSPVLEVTTGRLRLTPMIWGLRGPEPQNGLAFNARSERVFELHREAMVRRRCLVAVAGFFVFSGSERRRTRHFVTLAGAPLFTLAALFYPPRDADIAPRYSVLTTRAGARLGATHERMPVALDGESSRIWLYSNDPKALRKLFLPCPSLTMTTPPRSDQLELFGERSPD